MPLYRTSRSSPAHCRDDESPVPGAAADSTYVLPKLAVFGPPIAIPEGAVCSLRAVGASPGIARDFTAATLRSWGLQRVCDDAEIVVSELVTNAIRYGLPMGPRPAGDRPVRLTLVRHGCLVVCIVADASRREPAMHDPCESAESGRGLHVIEALSRTWGCTPLPGEGKVVWAALTVS